MRIAIRSVILIVIAFFITTSQARADEDLGSQAMGQIVNHEGNVIGKVTFTQGIKGVIIDIDVMSLSPGKHGMHIHEIGDCSHLLKFKKSGDHIMSHQKPHGFMHPGGPHSGDLPNVIVRQDGTAKIQLYSTTTSVNGTGEKSVLLDKDGSALIIHLDEDDHFTQPSGGSGDRIACASLKPLDGKVTHIRGK